MAGRSFSVVVCTLNRAESLKELLPALQGQTHSNFEVIIVAGPSDDHTDVVLAEWADQVKVVRNPDRNLSKSRNLGINESAGELVAFIDDDGVPEPTWLEELAVPYDDPEVAGAGGVVRDHTGWAFQCRFNCADRLGRSDPSSERPLDDMCFPGTWQYPYLIGTNSSFRRDLLVMVGGFDEEFEFYLDETDVCLRLIDAGYRLTQLRGAEVLHKFMPSGMRNESRVTWDLFSVVKNKIYFSLINGLGERTLDEIMGDNSRFVAELRADLTLHSRAGRITSDQYRDGLQRLEDAWPQGIAAGFAGRQKLLESKSPGEFQRFETRGVPEQRLHVAFVTQSLPPQDMGGIGRYMLDTARALADRGHEVRIITTGEDHNTVDLEHGVWVHRILKGGSQSPSVIHGDIPDRVWRNAAAVCDEIDRVHRRRPIDLVTAAMWDVETVAVLERLDIPVVTTLVTTLGITLDTKPEWTSNDEFMGEFVEPMLRLERWAMQESSLVHAISEAVATEAIAVAGADVSRDDVVVAPLGVADHLGEPAAPTERKPTDSQTVLFVGRLEKRKGIDLLLGAAEKILTTHPSTILEVIGRDDIPGENGRLPRSTFEEVFENAPWMNRVHFRGVVSDEDLWEAYRKCDVFVAPSRFESFGLVYVEAMMAGKPVVAVNAGAAPEVVDHSQNGLLTKPTSQDLADAISTLLDDPAMAMKLGADGRASFSERFTVDAMASSFENMMVELIQKESQ